MHCCHGCRPKTQGAQAVNDSRKFPWLGGLAAAITVAVLLIAVAIHGTLQVIDNFANQVTDASYQP